MEKQTLRGTDSKIQGSGWRMKTDVVYRTDMKQDHCTAAEVWAWHLSHLRVPFAQIYSHQELGQV